MKIAQYSLTIVMIMFGFGSYVQGEQKYTADNFEIHYSVFNSSFLQPDIAKNYALIRSKDSAVLTISVLENQDNGSSLARSAIITGSASDLIHNEPLSFTKIREQNAIYYIAAFRFSNETTYRFKLAVQPDPDAPPINFEFSRKLFHDE